MAVNIDQIKSLLGIGLSQEQVSSAVGCTVGYISQLMGDEKFAEEVAEKRTGALQAATERDLKIDKIEDTLIGKVASTIDQGMIYKPRDLLAAFAIVNKAARRGVTPTAAPVLQQQVVTLNIPMAIMQKFTYSQSKEVIGVDEQTLVTMNSTTLLRELQTSEALTIDGKKGENGRYAEVAKYLPGQHLPESKLLTEQHGFGGDRKSKNFNLRKQEREELRLEQAEGS